ncbi:MAG: hypothetical protein ABSH47_15085, partial [Bryobacteraceae bacterium]|jgi:hypothetical protein
MRPKTVPIVAAFLFMATAIAAVVGVSLLFPNPLLDRLWELNKPGGAAFRAMGRISGMLLLALGVGTAAAGLGLLRRRRWAWCTVNGCGDVVGFVATRDWLRSGSGVAVAAAFVYALTRPRTRDQGFDRVMVCSYGRPLPYGHGSVPSRARQQAVSIAHRIMRSKT